MKSFIFSIAGCLFLAAFSSSAAADGAPYLGADLGQSHFSGDIFGSRGFASRGANGTVDDTSSAHRFIFGYQITPYWGVEASFVHLGEGTSSYRDKPSMGFVAEGTERISVTGFSVVGTATWPIDERWSLHAHAGTIASSLKFDRHCNDGSCALGSHAQDSGAGLTYGVGAKWNVLSNLFLRLGWDHYSNLGDADYTANLISLGVEWRFSGLGN